MKSNLEQGKYHGIPRIWYFMEVNHNRILVILSFINLSNEIGKKLIPPFTRRYAQKLTEFSPQLAVQSMNQHNDCSLYFKKKEEFIKWNVYPSCQILDIPFIIWHQCVWGNKKCTSIHCHSLLCHPTNFWDFTIWLLENIHGFQSV